MLQAVRREPAAATLALVAAAGLALVLVYPIASVLREAVVGDEGLDPAPLVRILANPVARQIVLNTLLMGAAAAACGTALGFVFALATARRP